MTSSDFADDVITIGVFDGFLGAPGKYSLWPEFLSDEVGWPLILKLRSATITYNYNNWPVQLLLLILGPF